MAKLSGVVAAFCARFYNGRFSSETNAATVGTSASTIVKNNPERAGLLIINLSANTVVIRPGGVPTLTAGILLSPNGGSFSTDLLNDLTLPTYQFQAIADGAGSEVMIVETTRFEILSAEEADNAG